MCFIRNVKCSVVMSNSKGDIMRTYLESRRDGAQLALAPGGNIVQRSETIENCFEYRTTLISNTIREARSSY